MVFFFFLLSSSIFFYDKWWVNLWFNAAKNKKEAGGCVCLFEVEFCVGITHTHTLNSTQNKYCAAAWRINTERSECLLCARIAKVDDTDTNTEQKTVQKNKAHGDLIFLPDLLFFRILQKIG
jgi:hypothetical protein